MFESCSSLSVLNVERLRLARSGVPLMEVNAAYTKAKRRLLEDTPSYRKIPTYTGIANSVSMFTPFPFLKGQGAPNEIVITPEGVLL